MDDLADIEFLIETLLSTGLEGIRSNRLVPAAEAPGAGEVLLAEEVPHIVLKGQSAILHFRLEVRLESIEIGRSLLISTHLILLLVLDMVVQLLGHGVIKGEFLVGTEEIACKTQDKTKVSSKSTASVSNGLASGVNSLRLAALSEMHREVSVLGVNAISKSFPVFRRHVEESTECVRDIKGGVLVTWVPLGHVGGVDEFIVSEVNLVLNDFVSLALEIIFGELNNLMSEL